MLSISLNSFRQQREDNEFIISKFSHSNETPNELYFESLTIIILLTTVTSRNVFVSSTAE